MFMWTILENLNLPFDLPTAGIHKGWPSLAKWETSLYDSVTGGYTHAVFGNFRHDFILAERSDSVQVFGDLFQFLYSPNQAAVGGVKKGANLLYDFMVSGSDTQYTFGKRKDLNFHFTPGFKVDRINSGSFSKAHSISEEQMKSLRYHLDEWEPVDTAGKKKMIMPGLFCASMVAIKLLMDYEFNFTATTDFRKDEGAKTSGESHILQLPWFKLTAQNLLTGIGLMNSIFTAFLEFVEKAFCTEDLLMKKLFPQLKRELKVLNQDSYARKKTGCDLMKLHIKSDSILAACLTEEKYDFSSNQYFRIKQRFKETKDILDSEKNKINGVEWYLRGIFLDNDAIKASGATA
jgi:hypothetical protein